MAADPDYALGHFNLGVARAQGNKITEALIAFEQALEIDPTNIRAHLALATASASQGDLPRAQLALEAAAEHDPSAEPYLLMTQIALAAKDQSEAQAALEKAKLREPQHPDLQVLEQRLRTLAPK